MSLGRSVSTHARVATATIRALSALRGSSRPALSEQTIPGQLVISFAPAPEPQALAVSAAFSGGFALSTRAWASLDTRLAQIAEPRVPTATSPAALADSGRHHDR